MPFVKPNVNDVWANSGAIVEPAQAKVNQGWVSEIPDFEFENWVQNRSDSFAAHVNQYGIPVWDAVTEYQAGKSYVQGSDGAIYKAITTNTNKNPVSNPSDWGSAFATAGTSYSKAESDNLYLAKSGNLSGLANVVTSRTNLGVYSKAEGDSRYLLGSNNLSDLSNTATARSNLGVYSTTDVFTKTEADGRFMRGSNNLSELTNTATARTTLGVYSKTEADTQYQTSGPLVGMVVAFPVDTAPSGWLACNGAAVSRSTYAGIFNRIGTTWGAGDGSTTFNLPDLRGEFIRGLDAGRGVDSGRTIGTSQGEEIKSHTHTASTNSAGSHSHSGTTASAGSHTHNMTYTRSGENMAHFEVGQVAGGNGVDNITSSSAAMSSAGSHSHTFNTSSAGSHSHTVTVNNTGGSETRPRNVAMLYCIKA